MWRCLNCGEESDDNFDICWNCQTEKDKSSPSPPKPASSSIESVLSSRDTDVYLVSNNHETNDRLHLRPSLLVCSIILISFSLVILGFFLSWGSSFLSGEALPGSPYSSSYSITIQHTGKTAGNYGYNTLALGVIGCVVGCIVIVISLLKRPLPTWALWIIRAISAFGILLLTIIMRGDPKVRVFGSVGYALKEGDFTLGYPSGPGIALIGFIIAVIASFFAVRKQKRV